LKEGLNNIKQTKKQITDTDTNKQPNLPISNQIIMIFTCSRGSPEFFFLTFWVKCFLYRVPVKCEMKRETKHAKRNETKRNSPKRNEIYRNETKSRRNEINRNEIDRNETKWNNTK